MAAQSIQAFHRSRNGLAIQLNLISNALVTLDEYLPSIREQQLLQILLVCQIKIVKGGLGGYGLPYNSPSNTIMGRVSRIIPHSAVVAVPLHVGLNQQIWHPGILKSPAGVTFCITKSPLADVSK